MERRPPAFADLLPPAHANPLSTLTPSSLTPTSLPLTHLSAIVRIDSRPPRLGQSASEATITNSPSPFDFPLGSRLRRICRRLRLPSDNHGRSPHPVNRMPLVSFSLDKSFTLSPPLTLSLSAFTHSLSISCLRRSTRHHHSSSTLDACGRRLPSAMPQRLFQTENETLPPFTCFTTALGQTKYR